MRIGIDLDDTLSQMKDIFDLQICQYAKSIGRTPNYELLKQLHKDQNAKNIYHQTCGMTLEEMRAFFHYYHDHISPNNPARPHCSEVLQKLKAEGNEIIVITARERASHPDVYNITLAWLDKNNIPYDKLIIEGGDKGVFAKEENIDIFIDDNLNNCIECENVGIPAIRFCNELSEKSTNDWLEVYEMIKNLKNRC